MIKISTATLRRIAAWWGVACVTMQMALGAIYKDRMCLLCQVVTVRAADGIFFCILGHNCEHFVHVYFQGSCRFLKQWFWKKNVQEVRCATTQYFCLLWVEGFAKSWSCESVYSTSIMQQESSHANCCWSSTTWSIIAKQSNEPLLCICLAVALTLVLSLSCAPVVD